MEPRSKSEKRRKWSKATREKVLRRCFFTCVRPGCTEPAIDLHHIKLWSEYGSDDPANLLGLCKPCHRWIHAKVSNNPAERYERLEIARKWLPDQIDEEHARVDPVRQNVLFDELLEATKSVEHLSYHLQSIRDKNAWNAYEVFLKAAWTLADPKADWKLLEKDGIDCSILGCVVLERMVDLYRRRPGRNHNRAAHSKLRKLKKLIDEGPNNPVLLSLMVRAAYHEAYLSFLQDAASLGTSKLFDEAALIAKVNRDQVGEFIALSKSSVVRIRRRERITSSIHDLLMMRDSLGSRKGSLADRWTQEDLPLHIATAELSLGEGPKATEQFSGLLVPKTDLEIAPGNKALALYYHALMVLDDRGLADGIDSLTEVRRLYYSHSLTEGKAAILVSLGDAYAMDSNVQMALKYYKECLRQPAHMDNQQAIKIAKERLAVLRTSPRFTPERVFQPWQLKS